jgi:hypothetical protein
MKRFRAAAIAAALLCLLPVYAPGQGKDITPASPTAGATLDLVGPTGPIQPGEEAELRLAGLTLEELQAAQDLGNFDLTAWPLSGLRLRSYYDWMDRRLKLDFRAARPGEYLVKLHLVRNGAQEIAAVVVTVAGEVPPVPPPDPTPQPNPHPTPPANWQAAVKPILHTHPTQAYAQAKAEVFSRLGKTVQEESALRSTADLYQLLAGESSDGDSDPAVRAAVAGVIDQALGRKPVALDREEAAAMLQAIAWALWEAGP